MAELPLAGSDDLAAKVAGHELHAVADAEDRHAEFKELLGHRRSALFVDRLRPAGEDDPGRRKGANLRHRHIEGMKLAIDVGFTHPPGDELGVLGTEIEDKDLFAMDVVHGVLRK